MVDIKFLNDTDTLFLIVILETIIILCILILYLVNRESGQNDKYKNANYDKSGIISKKEKSITEWISKCNQLESRVKELECLLGYYGIRINNNSNSYSHRVNHKWIVNTDNKPQQDNSDNPYADYTEKERSRGIYVKEKTNDDGTIKSEIEFDLTDEKSGFVDLPTKYEYLEAANAGQFRKLLPSDEKCFFRTWEENGKRKFEFHGNIEKALANINAIFDDVCEIEGKQNGASNITNVEPGILDSKLKVEKLAKIKLT